MVQDTGLGDTLEVGEGLVTFVTPEQAVRRARSIVAEYPRHRPAARRLAETVFAPGPALAPLIPAAGIRP